MHPCGPRGLPERDTVKYREAGGSTCVIRQKFHRLCGGGGEWFSDSKKDVAQSAPKRDPTLRAFTPLQVRGANSMRGPADLTLFCRGTSRREGRPCQTTRPRAPRLHAAVVAFRRMRGASPASHSARRAAPGPRQAPCPSCRSTAGRAPFVRNARPAGISRGHAAAGRSPASGITPRCRRRRGPGRPRGGAPRPSCAAPPRRSSSPRRSARRCGR